MIFNAGRDLSVMLVSYGETLNGLESRKNLAKLTLEIATVLKVDDTLAQ